MLLVGRAGARPGAPDFGDLPVVVEGHVATRGEQCVDLRAGALDPCLHARDRQADDARRLDLRELAEVSEGQGLAVWLWQPPDQRLEAAGELLAALGFVGIFVGVAICVDSFDQVVGRGRDLSRARAGAIVVDDRVARDAVGERVEPVLEAQVAEAAMQAQQYLLSDVVGGVRVADPPANEAAQAFVDDR